MSAEQKSAGADTTVEFETTESPDQPGQIRSWFEAGRRIGEENRELAALELEKPEDRAQFRASQRGDRLDVVDPEQYDTIGHKALRTAIRAQIRVENATEKFAAAERAQMGGRMFSLVFGAVALGLTIIVLQLMILIGGEFSAAIPAGGSFASAANSTETNGNTAFEIMSVATLVIPVVVVVGLLIGAFMSSGGVGNLRNRAR